MRRTKPAKTLQALLAAALLALTAPLLAACASDGSGDDSARLADDRSGDGAGGAALTFSDGWAKAGETGGMTGVFGTLVNSSGEDLVITGVESDAAGMIELHEVTADGVMQRIEGDVVVPADGSFELAPGANHIMLMDLTRDLLAGDEVSLTLHCSSSTDGDELSFEFTVLVKDYSGANEEYGGEHGDEHSEHAEHDAH